MKKEKFSAQKQKLFLKEPSENIELKNTEFEIKFP